MTEAGTPVVTGDAPIHQVVMGWTDGRGRREPGFGVLASSLERDQLEASRWEERLRAWGRMEHARSAGPPPEHTIAYLNWPDDTAAVLFRTGAPNRNARQDRCHCLVGPVDTLTARLALGLAGWRG